MTGSVTKRKGKKRVSQRNINENKESTAFVSASTNSSNVNNVMIFNRDSDDSDYEDEFAFDTCKRRIERYFTRGISNWPQNKKAFA